MPIPDKIKKKLEKAERMKKCAVCSTRNGLQWHHCWTYSARQIQELWAIVAVCERCHDECTPHKNTYNPKTRYTVELISLQMMTSADEQKYFKRDWQQEARGLFYELSKYDRS